ncbi:MAG: pilus assembly PilX family protein, partial [Planctomycetota bacterium]
MNSYKGRNRELRDGAVLIIAVIFVALFSSLGLAILSMSSSNVQIADNHYKANRALESAQSGLEVTRYWLGRIAMPGTVTPTDRFATLTGLVDTELQTANICATTPSAYDEDGACAVNLGSTTINSQTGQSFDASIQKTANLDVVKVTVTGGADSITRTVSVNCEFDVREHNVFDYGVATKGPLSMLGSTAIDGVAVAADVYIESNSLDNEELFIKGNSQIAGDVQITNPDGYATLVGGQAGIGGQTGAAAQDH